MKWVLCLLFVLLAGCNESDSAKNSLAEKKEPTLVAEALGRDKIKAYQSMKETLKKANGQKEQEASEW